MSPPSDALAPGDWVGEEATAAVPGRIGRVTRVGIRVSVRWYGCFDGGTWHGFPRRPITAVAARRLRRLDPALRARIPVWDSLPGGPTQAGTRVFYCTPADVDGEGGVRDGD